LKRGKREERKDEREEGGSEMGTREMWLREGRGCLRRRGAPGKRTRVGRGEKDIK